MFACLSSRVRDTLNPSSRAVRLGIRRGPFLAVAKRRLCGGPVFGLPHFFWLRLQGLRFRINSSRSRVWIQDEGSRRECQASALRLCGVFLSLP